MTRLRSWLEDERGASAAEFALILIPFLTLIFAIIHVGLLVYSFQQLTYATEATARCMVTAYSSNYTSATCKTDTSARSYFTAHYNGATSTPTLSPSPDMTANVTADCGTSGNYQLSATANYVIRAVIVTKTVPLSATACFPHT